MASPASPLTAGFHVMTKPIGPICNLDCTYCFYLEKEKLFPQNENYRMSDEVLEAYVRSYIRSQEAPEISFAWQGGEPTLLGVDFFRRAVAYQKKYADGKRITNAIQTNGTLLDDAWCEFLAENGFLVGLSIDGPRKLHDTYRVDRKQGPTFDTVVRGLEFLRKHETEFNTLTVVNRLNGDHPLEVYRFLKEIGSGFMQFIPLVERLPDRGSKELQLELAMPPDLLSANRQVVTDWSLRPRQHGEFLSRIFDEWVRNDVGRVFVQMFDVALGNWMGAPPGLCVFSPTCGRALAMEHNGDVYSCDHYVYPQFKLGNVLNESIGEMVDSDFQRKFGSDKLNKLPGYCLKCEYRFACHGECTKHRFETTPDGEAGLNYLCPSYKLFFKHIDPYMRTMTDLLRRNRPPAEIVDILRNREEIKRWKTVKRNDPCPCGSGKKFKICCMNRRG